MKEWKTKAGEIRGGRGERKIGKTDEQLWKESKMKIVKDIKEKGRGGGETGLRRTEEWEEDGRGAAIRKEK